MLGRNRHTDKDPQPALEFDEEFDDNLPIGEELLARIDGHRGGGRRGRKRRTHKPHKKYNHDGSYSEHLLEQIAWRANVIMILLSFGIVLFIGTLVATIIAAVKVGTPAAEMVSGMSKNVITMTKLGTGAPTQMTKAWESMDGDNLMKKVQNITKHVAHMLGRIEADPNLNDKVVNLVASIIGRTNHFLGLISDTEWTQIKANGIKVMESASSWSENVPASLVRETLEKGRDFSNEAQMLLHEARENHILDTVNDAGRAATILGNRVSQLDEITIKLPPPVRANTPRVPVKEIAQQ